ncbi:adenosylcobinamide-GDP ribazoletransferase [Paenibacillus sp. J2TS4]|uniref:adenosylcobinamide-GDP ribazoletransferase n=1 Tax=Paenibacillus sp. J2TS4 TaxID=2807194 RepID=UPI001B190813|nr:adenosylcobinamide-GDP ribazoletransferase [Paenibacillus sp. J2TS4]GIP34364.1 adenosylcobinamide-GDP ribazoletransferase [Paenibacillus sp. J2TS4]
MDRHNHRLIAVLHSCAAAFQLLTRFPCPVAVRYTDEVFRRSVLFYPVVGLAIGLVLAALGTGVQALLPAFPASVILLALWVFMTGALHLDGWMDTADGILSYRSRERMLEIMKDSRVGAMGVIAGVLYLLLKLSLLFVLLDENWAIGAAFIICIPIWSRTYMVAAIAGWPYARSDSGMGSVYREVRGKQAWAVAIIAMLLTCAVLLLFGWGWMETLQSAVLLLAVTGMIGWAFASYLSSKLGGLTGDTYGAINEGCELAQLLAIVVYIGWL